MKKLTRRDFLKTSLAGAMGVTALALGGCGEKEDKAAAKHNTIKVGVSQDPKSVAPYALGSDARKMLCFHIYQCAMHFLKTGDTPIPQICESYDVDYDSMTVTVKVRDGVHDSEGNPITASDVAYSYAKTKEVANSASYDYMESVEAIDDNTVVFTWSPDYIYKRNNVENALANGGVYIFSQKAYEASEDAMVTDPVGTGSFKVTNYVVGASVTLEKNDNFWMEDAGVEIPYDYKATFDKVEVSVITESSQIAIALETGDIDATANCSAQDIALFEEGGQHADDFNVIKTETFLGYTLTFNTSTEYGCSSNLRHAVFHAVDIDGMVKRLCNGQAVTVHAPWGSENFCADYNPEWNKQEYYPYSLDTAKEYLDKYLAESGKSLSDVTLKFAVQNNADCDKPAEILQASLIELGVNVEMTVYDAATFNTITTEKDAFDFSLWAMAGNGTYSAWNFNASSNSSFFFDQDSDEYKELLELAEACMDRRTWNQEASNALWQYNYEHAYSRGLYKRYDNIVVPKWVTETVINFNHNPMYGCFIHE